MNNHEKTEVQVLPMLQDTAEGLPQLSAAELHHMAGDLLRSPAIHSLPPEEQASLKRGAVQNMVVVVGALARLFGVGTNVPGASLEVAKSQEPEPLSRPPAPSELPRSGPEYCFTRDGDVWRITFEGQSTALPPVQGMLYLHKLLMHEGQDVPVQSLEGAGDSQPLASSDELMDQETMRGIEDRLKALPPSIESARASGDHALAAELRREFDCLLAEHGKAKGLGGRTRAFPNEYDQCRQRVAQSIRRVLKALKSKMPRLYAHLNEAIQGKSSGAPSYRPRTRIPWTL